MSSVTLKWVPSVIGTRVERLGVLIPGGTLLCLACEPPAQDGLALAKVNAAKLVVAVPRHAEPSGTGIRRLPVPECPAGMVSVEGEYCPKVEHRCAEWLDPPGRFRRCRRYEQPARCLVRR